MPYIPGRKRAAVEPYGDLRGKKKHSNSRPPEDIDVLKLQKAYLELNQAHQEVRETQIEMILNLAIAAEYKDPDTGNHILRISDYSTQIAGCLGLSAQERDHLRYASPMHDIGKIGIPDRILQKPGKLNPEEWEVMKQHTLAGARMFQSGKSALLRAAADIALTHHEKYDGSGYPQGLKGKEIPLFGRIVAVADIFDAIVSKRCYKEEATFEEGMAYIESVSGTYLDPEITDFFIQSKENVRKIYEANQSIQQFILEAKDMAEGTQRDLGLA